jgi:hypothetical protein
MSGDRFVWEDGHGAGSNVSIAHLDGIPWHAAPVPPRRHTCWTQTEGWTGLTQVWRCACGAAAMPRRYEKVVWIERNTRTGAEPEPEPTSIPRGRRFLAFLGGAR